MSGEGNQVPRGLFQDLPSSLATELFTILDEHRMLSPEVLRAFEGCDVRKLNLSRVAAIDDVWLLPVSHFAHLGVLDLSKCAGVTDYGAALLCHLGIPPFYPALGRASSASLAVQQHLSQQQSQERHRGGKQFPHSLKQSSL